MDLSNIMQMAGNVREQLNRSQEEAAKLRVTGEAGGGMVRVVLNGRYEAVEMFIDPKAVEKGEVSLLEDLIRAAFNQAAGKVSGDLQSRMGNFAESLGVNLSDLGLDIGNK